LTIISCVIAQVRCFEMSLTVRLKRLEREATSLLLLLLLLLDEEEDEDEDEEDEDDAGESTDKAVLAEVPSSSSTSSTAARFLPRPLVCLDAAAVVAFSFLLDIAGG
jgi:hypothetical protein